MRVGRLLTMLGGLVLLGLTPPAIVRAACAPGGTCSPTNILLWSNATTNVNGSPLTNFAGFDARIGTAPGVCTSASSVVRNLGPLGLGTTPAAGTSQIALNAASLGLTSGSVYLVLHTRTTTGVRSACSSEVGFTYATTPPAGDTTPPSIPPAFGATVVSTSQINLSWTASTDNVGVTGYELERCTGAGCTSFVKIAATAATSVSNTGLQVATTYRYRARAMDAVPNPSAYSPIITATTLGTSPPVTQITVACLAASCKLQWPATAGATSYRIARVSGTGWAPVVTTSATNVNISWLTGVNQYGVFSIMPSGEGIPIGYVFISKP